MKFEVNSRVLSRRWFGAGVVVEAKEQAHYPYIVRWDDGSRSPHMECDLEDEPEISPGASTVIARLTRKVYAGLRWTPPAKPTLEDLTRGICTLVEAFTGITVPGKVHMDDDGPLPDLGVSWLKPLYDSVVEALGREPARNPAVNDLREVVIDLRTAYRNELTRTGDVAGDVNHRAAFNLIHQAVNAGYFAERNRRLELESEIGRKDTDLRNTIKQLQETKREYVSESVHRITQSERDAWCARAQKAEEKLAAIQATLAK